MIAGDLVYSDEIETGCNFKIFEGQWNDGGKMLWDTKKDGWSKPPCALLDRQVEYVTIDAMENSLVVGVR